MFKKITCKLFGHIPYKVIHKKFEATCYRCGTRLRVTYDMCYGETVVIEEIPERVDVNANYKNKR